MANRHASVGSKTPPDRREEGIISGEAYPELQLRARHRPSPAARPPEQAVPEGDSSEDPREILEEGRFQERSPEACRHLLAQLLEQGRFADFTRGTEHLSAGLASDSIALRRWALESIQALADGEGQALIPHGTLTLFIEGVGRCLVAEADPGLRELAMECAALLAGAVAAAGDLEGARGHLARIAHDAGASGAELRKRILSSKSLCLAPLRLYFREGRSVLESRLLPFFRMAGVEGARGLIRHLEDEENRQRRHRILEILKALAPLSLEPVKESLRAEAWYMVRNALNLLGELGDPDSFESASRFLEHPDLRIRRAAVRAFWKTGGLRTESYLLDLLPRCDPETQAEILVGLAQIGAPSAVAPVAGIASQAEEPLRIRCIDALGQLGRPDAVPALARFLKQEGRIFRTRESAAVREAAARALMAIGTPHARASLAEAVRAAPRNGDQAALRKILEKPGWS